jgi:hypothetical protein
MTLEELQAYGIVPQPLLTVLGRSAWTVRATSHSVETSGAAGMLSGSLVAQRGAAFAHPERAACAGVSALAR